MNRMAKSDWADMAVMDPYWAVLSHAQYKYDNWDPQAFFDTGRAYIDLVLAEAKKIGLPLNNAVVLDFGCGLGRLTRPLSRRFRSCYAVDISQGMLAQAKKLNPTINNCLFLQHASRALPFSSNRVDMIVTKAVLQHMPRQSDIMSTIAEFIRIIKPGGLIVAQIPSSLPLHRRIQFRRRLYHILRAFGISASVLYYKLGLNPIIMNPLPEKRVLEVVEKSRGSVLRVWRKSGGSEDRTYFITKNSPFP